MTTPHNPQSIPDFPSNGLPKYICIPSTNAVFAWFGPEGFGEFMFKRVGDKVLLNDEYMTKEFIKKRLCEMVDNCQEWRRDE